MAMDAKDLRTGTAISEHVHEGTNKFMQNTAAVSCNSNKTYQDLSKVDAPTSRPCAVIGPDRVLPQPPSNDAYLKKNQYEPWPPLDNTYRQPPEYPHKLTSYQSPIRNISPRQTFQENMQRIMVPPTYNNINMNEDTNYTLDRNLSQSKNKLNVPFEAKYCDVPYTINPMSDNQKNADICVPNINNPRNCPPMWHPSGVNVRPTRPYGASEVYQYPEYANCSGTRPVPIARPQRSSEDSSHVYADTYYPEGNVRFKPYPNVKDRYPQARYEYVSNYTNPFHPPQSFPPHKYDMQKNLPHPPYPQVPIKYLDNRMSDSIIDGYQRPVQQINYNVPYRNQMIHPAYGSMLTNGLQNKVYPYPPEGQIKTGPSNKLPYDNSKVYIDYENTRNKVYTGPDNYYINDMVRPHLKNQVLIPNYSSMNMQPIPPHPYYRKESHLPKTYDYSPHFRHMDPSINVNHLNRLAAQFSPNAIAISPSDSNTSNDTVHTQGTSLEDCGYVSQSSAASVRSVDSSMTRFTPNDIHRRYNYPFQHMIRNLPMTAKSDMHTDNSKDKKSIDVRQFLQSWNEGDEENSGNTKEIITSSDYNDPSKSSSHYESVKNQEQLYVLGLVNVPSEELEKYEHIQKIYKLPDNIKGYNNIELLKHFEEAIESSNLTNFNQKSRSYLPPIKRLLPQGMGHSARPVSPLDVEAKISQSVIHKEVGCNFEIKPCSPQMMNVEIATPAHNILGERIIEKVTNPLSSSLIPNVTENDQKANNIKQSEHISMLNDNLKITSCQMINTQCSINDAIETIKPNYCLQDLESNSGVCLASLPRLDNDIELNFQEVNQQFINANKVDSVIIANSLLSTSEITADNINFNTDLNESDINSKSLEIHIENVPKLSKYRKNKSSETKESFSNSQCIRTDSVIIKNPDNIKSFDEVQSSLSNIDDVNEESINKLSPLDPLSKDVRSRRNELVESNVETCNLSNEMAIDFSLNKNDNIFPSIVEHVDNNNTGYETREIHISKPSSEKASNTIKNNPDIKKCATMCAKTISAIFQDNRTKLVENNDTHGTVEENSPKILHANNFSFSDQDTLKGDDYTAVTCSNTLSLVDQENTMYCTLNAVEKINVNNVNSNENIADNSELCHLKETEGNICTPNLFNKANNCSDNMHLDDFLVQNPKPVIKDHNNEKICDNDSDVKIDCNISTKGSSDTKEINLCNITHHNLDSKKNNAIDKIDTNLLRVGASPDETVNTNLDKTDLKILEDSAYNSVNNTNEDYCDSAVIKDTKTCRLKKELFSPWIQKLTFYSEGNILNNKFTTNQCILTEHLSQPEGMPIKASPLRSSNFIEPKLPDIVSESPNNAMWFNGLENVNSIFSDDNNGFETTAPTFTKDDVTLTTHETNIIQNTDQEEENNTIEEKQPMENQNEVEIMLDQKKVSSNYQETIENVKLSAYNKIQTDYSAEIYNSPNKCKLPNDDQHLIEKISDVNMPAINIQNDIVKISNESKLSIRDKNYKISDESKLSISYEIDKISDQNKLSIGYVEIISDESKILIGDEVYKISDKNKLSKSNEIDKISDGSKPSIGDEIHIMSDESKLLPDKENYKILNDSKASIGYEMDIISDENKLSIGYVEIISDESKNEVDKISDKNKLSKSDEIDKISDGSKQSIGDEIYKMSDESKASIDYVIDIISDECKQSIGYKDDKISDENKLTISCVDKKSVKSKLSIGDENHKISKESNLSTGDKINKISDENKLCIGHTVDKILDKSKQSISDDIYKMSGKNKPSISKQDKEIKFPGNNKIQINSQEETEKASDENKLPNDNQYLIENILDTEQELEKITAVNNNLLTMNGKKDIRNNVDENQEEFKNITKENQPKCYNHGERLLDANKLSIAFQQNVNKIKRGVCKLLPVYPKESEDITDYKKIPIKSQEVNKSITNENNLISKFQKEIKDNLDEKELLLNNQEDMTINTDENQISTYNPEKAEIISDIIISSNSEEEIKNSKDETLIINPEEIKNILNNNQETNAQEETENILDTNKQDLIGNQHRGTIETQKLSLKRSLSDSAIDLLDTNNIHNFPNDQLEHGSVYSRRKRKKHFLPNICNSQFDRTTNNLYNNRRNSISSTYNEENLSFCIVIDDSCIITEDNEDEKICYTELPENCLDEINNCSTEEESLKFPTQIILCQRGESSTYAEPFVLEIAENKPFEESWIDDIACVETVVSDDIAEDITLSAPSSPKDLEELDVEDSDLINNISEHTEKVKYIYGEKMCNDDAELLETLFRTPQMNVNKTLTSRESHDNDFDTNEGNDFIQITNSPKPCTFNCEQLNTESLKFSNSLEKTVEHAVHLLSGSISMPNKDHVQTTNILNTSGITYTSTQYDTVNSCETSVDDVFSYSQETNPVHYDASSSPEVSSTTPEEKNATILLKITNYKGMRKSELNDVTISKNNNNCSKSCKFTENINYTNYPNSSKPRPLITKAAQKYIPPAKQPINDLKVKLVLPQQSLLKLKQLKISKGEPNQVVCQKKDIPIKIKPRFEDVLKSIDEIQIKMHKEKNKKPKKSVPKVVIKKNGNGSHYTSTADKDTFNPDLTGRKWQPWVFIEKNSFIDKMALKNKTKAIFNHRKNTYVFADKFKKYKSISNTKFVISQPKTDESSVGQLKYTIRLKHAY